METWTAEVNVTEAVEIALYRRVFDRYVAVARYGSAARQLVSAVLAEVAPLDAAADGNRYDEVIDAAVPPQLGRDSQ